MMRYDSSVAGQTPCAMTFVKLLPVFPSCGASSGVSPRRAMLFDPEVQRTRASDVVFDPSVGGMSVQNRAGTVEGVRQLGV